MAEFVLKSGSKGVIMVLPVRLDTKLGGSGGGDGDDDGAMSPMAIAQMTCDEILEEVNEKKFPTDDVSRGMNEEDKGPYQFVFLQECEYMNALLYEMVKGLQETRFFFGGQIWACGFATDYS